MVAVPSLLLMGSGAMLRAQEVTLQEEEAMPDSADVASLDAVVRSVYEVISGAAGAPRDWDRMRSLFLPEARLVPSWVDDDGSTQYRVLSTEEWIASAERFFADNPFYETEMHRVLERYGRMAHVFSTYESRRDPSEEAFARGINSFQLLSDGKRWWVLTIYWQAETPATPIPKEYLP
jgi:hypothetical protein